MKAFLSPAYFGHKKRIAVLVAILVLLAVACFSATVTPEPSPSHTAEPTPTIAPTAMSAAISGSTDLHRIDAEAFATLEAILTELGPRESTTDQESAAAEFLKTNLQELGYDVQIQTFIVENLSLAGMGLTLGTPGSPESQEFMALPMVESGLGDVSGSLISVGLAMPGDIPDSGLEGRIALAKRGVITFQAKAENVFAAGAVGLVVYNNVFGGFRGVLTTESEFPVISISRTDGETIEDLLAESDTEASFDLVLVERSSQNVIAEKTGPGDAVVVLGGHYDTVPEISGANDNASGTAVLLTIARLLAESDLPFTLKIVPFGSEELGLLGSKFYVQSLSEDELQNTKVMLNFDALGTGPEVSVFGDDDLVGLLQEVGGKAGIDISLSRGPGSSSSSDFASFRDAGVTYAMFFGDDVSRIHMDCDTIEFVRPEMLGGAATATAALLESPEFEALIKDQ